MNPTRGRAVLVDREFDGAELRVDVHGLAGHAVERVFAERLVELVGDVQPAR